MDEYLRTPAVCRDPRSSDLPTRLHATRSITRWKIKRHFMFYTSPTGIWVYPTYEVSLQCSLEIDQESGFRQGPD